MIQKNKKNKFKKKTKITLNKSLNSRKLQKKTNKLNRNYRKRLNNQN